MFQPNPAIIRFSSERVSVFIKSIYGDGGGGGGGGGEDDDDDDDDKQNVFVCSMNFYDYRRLKCWQCCHKPQPSKPRTI